MGNTVLDESKRNAAAAAAVILPRSEEQLDTREPSRLQSSLYRILRKREKAGDGGGTGQRQRRERDGGARVCTMENQKFEPMHREAHLRQDAARSCPADSFTAPGKEMIKKGGRRGEKERDNHWCGRFRGIFTAAKKIDWTKLITYC